MKYLFAAALLALSFAPATAEGIGTWEIGPWGVCTTGPKAYHIADLFTSAGEEISSDVFKQYLESGDCYVLPRETELFLQAVVHRVGRARVVRVADRENNEWYWLTTDPVTGEPQPTNKDF